MLEFDYGLGSSHLIDPPTSMGRLSFKLEKTASGSRARATRFKTLHNEVLTPTFMPVGTHASVRSQSREDLLDVGAQVLLANTYHLLLRPGVEIFEVANFDFSDITCRAK